MRPRNAVPREPLVTRVASRPNRKLRVLALCAAILAACAGCDWQMLGYGPDHTGFNPTENKISVGNVAGLVRRYPVNNATGACVISQEQSCSTPAVVNGSVYIGTRNGDLVVRDVDTGSVQWTAHTGGAISSSPAVVDGVVYVGSDDTKLYAFDAAGSANCSGSPKTCAPLWTGNAMYAVRSSPTVANGLVYVSIGFAVMAFSAKGTTNCSGNPKVCDAVWGTTLIPNVGSPAVANGVLYLSGDSLYAFDAAGIINCSVSAPKLCAPLWTGSPGSGKLVTSPAVANGNVYVVAGTWAGPFLEAFSADGTVNCSGTPKVCNPILAGQLDAGSGSVTTTPAIANGVVYVSSANGLSAFDAAGVTNCVHVFGSEQCTPLWTAEEINPSASPAVANGVVYVTDAFVDGDCWCIRAHILAYDGAGIANCSGTPKTCGALWSDLVGTNATSSAVVANGAVYLNNNLTIYKYSLP